MIATTSSRSPRRGFTLVELLVAMALIIFIMVILTEAFSAGTGVFRTLKSQGDMQERLRTATSLLRSDLVQTPTQSHFGPTDPLLLSALAGKPQQGYFFIQQPLGSAPEGTDGFGIPSFRMNTAAAPPPPANNLPALAFTLRRTGIQPTDYFAARIPGSAQYPATLPDFTTSEQLLFNVAPLDYQQPLPRTAAPTKLSGLLLSQWAEVGWFLVPTGGTAGTTNPVPLFSLRRRTRVVLNDPNTTAALNTGTDLGGNVFPPIPAGPPGNLWSARYAEVSCLPDATGMIYFNTPTDLANPAPAAVPHGGPGGQVMPTSFTKFADPVTQQGQADWSGDDVVLTDVVSFNVRVLFQLPANAQGQVLYTPEFQDVNQLAAGGVYDTGTTPLPITALEITLRVWDVKTSLARQVTMVVDM